MTIIVLILICCHSDVPGTFHSLTSPKFLTLLRNCLTLTWWYFPQEIENEMKDELKHFSSATIKKFIMITVTWFAQYVPREYLKHEAPKPYHIWLDNITCSLTVKTWRCPKKQLIFTKETTKQSALLTTSTRQVCIRRSLRHKATCVGPERKSIGRSLATYCGKQ